MKTKYATTMARYFAGQNESDAEAVTGLFAPNAEVFNVNLPLVTGRDAILAFCQNLYARTERRRFEVISVAVDDRVGFAEWRGEFVFRAGAKIGPFELARSCLANLRGSNKFEFDEAGRIKTLRIYHETTTVGQMAQQNAK